MLWRFKRVEGATDSTCMTTPSRTSGGRFRSGAVVPSTPQQQVEELLADGPMLSARYEELIDAAAAAGEADEIVALAATARGAADPHRVYAAQRLAATALHTMASTARSRADVSHWAPPLDRALQVLVPYLEQTPHEPELLYLLGVVAHDLGEVELARRVLTVVASIDRDHEPTRVALQQLGRAGVLRECVTTEPHAPTLQRLRPSIEQIVDRAAQVPERTISLCMIVKDEEDMLPECLGAVAPFVDQIVVVDTGSTDRTREIAAAHGALVKEFPWNGSFSDARNESLKHATGDWILWLDADERLVAEDGELLRELARRTWVEGFHIVETHVLDGDSSDLVMHAPMRLFQRRAHYRWTGTIHEQVSWALPNWLPGRVQHSAVRVDHYGYAADVLVDRAKGARNLQLLMTQHEQEPSAFTSFNIGTEHGVVGSWDDAHTWYERALTQARSESSDWMQQPWTPLLVRRAASARRLVGDVAGTLQLVDEGLTAWPEYTDLMYERARAHADAGEWHAAADDARAALALGDAPAHFVATSGKGTFQAHQLLACALHELGDSNGAIEQLEAALRCSPRYLVALTDLVDLLLADGAAIETIDATVNRALTTHAASASVHYAVGSRLHRAGHVDAAEARFQLALEAAPKHAQSLAELAEIRLAAGRMEEAWEIAMQIDEYDRLAPVAAMTAFRAAVVEDRRDLLAQPIERITQSSALPTSERSVFAAWHQLLAPDPSISSILTDDPIARRTLLDNLEVLAHMRATDAFEQLHSLTSRIIPDAYERGIELAGLYLRLSFADMAGEHLIELAQQFGPDAVILSGLGKVATLKQLWEDAEVFLTESLQLDPGQPEAARLLEAVQERRHA